ncbi:collagen alpha-1(I) chain-like [Pan paniscus]|uniref:collagen alpha-1(I) chain-like n=1 Tax=Pan paniscus TaxID=9597 RepID=UPI003005616D
MNGSVVQLCSAGSGKPPRGSPGLAQEQVRERRGEAQSAGWSRGRRGSRPASLEQPPAGDDANGSRERGRRGGSRRERERPQPAHFTPAVPPPAALANHSPGAAAGSLWSPPVSRVPQGAAGREAPPEAAGARAAPANPGANSRLPARLTEAGSGRPRGSAG